MSASVVMSTRHRVNEMVSTARIARHDLAQELYVNGWRYFMVQETRLLEDTCMTITPQIDLRTTPHWMLLSRILQLYPQIDAISSQCMSCCCMDYVPLGNLHQRTWILSSRIIVESLH